MKRYLKKRMMKDKGMLFMSKLPEKDFLHTEAFQWCEKPKEKEVTKIEYLVFGLAIGMLLTVGLQMLSTWI